MVRLAALTLALFEETVQRDQGNAFRLWLGRVIMHIGDAYRSDETPFRSHMGASGIGKECSRAIWYAFRWARPSRFTGRMLRLFNRGHLEEARFIALMMASGLQVWQQDENGKQFRVSWHGGHFGGAGDGVFIGCPDLPPNTPALCEFKTYNDKTFQKLKNDGMRKSKPEHYVQMQTYMRGMGLNVGVYFAVNKNDDEIYAEIIERDDATSDRFIERAAKIIPIHAPPMKLASSVGDFRCKFCDYKDVCHMGAPAARNCRTCEFVAFTLDGHVRCTVNDPQGSEIGAPIIDKQTQYAACDKYASNSKAFPRAS